MLHVERQQISL